MDADTYDDIQAEMGELRAEIERLRAQLRSQRCPRDVRGTIAECIDGLQCGCTNGLVLAHEQSLQTEK